MAHRFIRGYPVPPPHVADIIASESTLQMRDNERSRRLGREVHDMTLLVSDMKSRRVWMAVYHTDDTMYISGLYSS